MLPMEDGKLFSLTKIQNRVSPLLFHCGVADECNSEVIWCLSTFADILVGLLRLRKCSPNTYRPELKGGCSIVRELHVYPSHSVSGHT